MKNKKEIVVMKIKVITTILKFMSIQIWSSNNVVKIIIQ